VSRASRPPRRSARLRCGREDRGRKGHALVDGRALLIGPNAADAWDRDAGGALLRVSRSLFLFDPLGLGRRRRYRARIDGNRRLAKPVATTMKSAAAFLYGAAAVLMTCRIARSSCVSRTSDRSAVLKRPQIE